MVATDLKHCDDVFVARPFVKGPRRRRMYFLLCAFVLRSHLLLLPTPRMNISGLNVWLPIAH